MRQIKALRTITDCGNNIPRNEIATVSDVDAARWVALGWAEYVAKKATKK
jgi:hypothetical protein